MKKYSFIVALILAFAVILPSCSQSYDDAEIKEALRELLPKSAELNEIYFGEGLPLCSDREIVEAFFATFDSDIEAVNYHPVDPSCGYASEDDIRAATLEVFTAEYSEYLFERAFTGITAVIPSGEDGDSKQNAIYAMYLMQSGTLTVRIDLADDSIPLGREYDIERATVTRQRKNQVTVTVPSVLDGVTLDIELRLVKTDSGWRLDSPTY